jgi:hypothetical protein
VIDCPAAIVAQAAVDVKEESLAMEAKEDPAHPA